MFLVKFTGDNYYHICPEVKNKKNITCAKWGSTYYEVSVILESDNVELLENEMQKLQNSCNNEVIVEDITEEKEEETELEEKKIPEKLIHNEESGGISDNERSDPFSTDDDSDYVPSSSSKNAKTIFEDESSSDNSSSRETLSNIQGMEVVSPTGIVNIETVESSNKRTKKYFCKFCRKTVTKIARHLENVHREEDSVKAFSLLPKGCPERRKIIDLLRNAGSFMYNTNSAYNNGDLIVTRRPRPNLERNPTHFECCPKCKGTFSKVTLRHHAAKCLKPSERTDRSILVMGKRVRAAIHPDASSIVRDNIFPYLREDNAVKCIRYDKLVIRFCNQLCMKYRSTHHHKMIRSQMRLLGRFLFSLKESNTTIETMSDVFDPANFNAAIKTIGELGDYDETNNMMGMPNVPLHMGTLLKKVAKFHISECIKSCDEESRKKTTDFLTLLSTDFNAEITQTALESRLNMHRKKKIELPPDSDVHAFLLYILKNMKKMFEALSRGYAYDIWKELQSYCLLWIICFNRRRVGEVERMKIVDFQLHHGVDKIADKDIYDSLSSEGKQAACNFKRVSLRGKLGRTVHILLCKLVFNSLQLILRYRHKANVPAENVYVFGVPGQGRQKYLEACPLLRIHSAKCDASRPDLLRGTHLRKHIATRSVLLNLNDHEISDLANYMGHGENIHKSHYRLPIVAREITQISKLLEKAQGGELPNLHENLYEEDISTSSQECNNIDLLEGTSNTEDSTRISVERINAFLPTSKKTPWKADEINAIKNHFQNNLSNESIPNLNDCSRVRRESLELEKRSPQAIRGWIMNEIKRNSPQNKELLKTPVRRRWTTEEEKLLTERFSIYYNNGTLPSLKACKLLIEENPVLYGRTPEIVKAKINNSMRKARNAV